ncbi:hypothetical protein B0H16DRAFT_1381198 [Mycena metata]|uniref:Uncharacterized protein n=1 Tax=Mycena metata TaxID=1033252 RepID=A0AAD7I401_9AGAR|nr:hypothetical protein B0H16DRAFT_1381198 [Mycena metata]
MPISRRLSDGFASWMFVSSSGELSDGNKPYHPSDMINAYLLDSSPDAVVAVTHDDEWASVVTENKGLPSDAELLERVFDRYTIENRSDGGACLQHMDAAGVAEPVTPAEAMNDVGPNVPPDARYKFEDPTPDAMPDAENLESLGETVLRLVVTSIILDMYPRLQVGPSTQLRELLLDNAALNKISNECKLPKLQELQPLHAATKAFQVTLGVLYRNEGLESVNRLLEPVFRPYTARAYALLCEAHNRMAPPKESNTPSAGPSAPARASTPAPSGPSTPESPTNCLAHFNEALQKAGRSADWVYSGDGSVGSTSVNQGKAKAAWTAEVLVDGKILGRGEGKTKKIAKNEAAKQALSRV